MKGTTITWLDSNVKYYSLIISRCRAPHHLFWGWPCLHQVTGPINFLSYGFWCSFPRANWLAVEIDHLHAQTETWRMYRVIPPPPDLSLWHV